MNAHRKYATLWRASSTGNESKRKHFVRFLYIDNKGFPITKAMLKPRERQGIKEFWFSTNTSSNKVKFFRKNPK